MRALHDGGERRAGWALRVADDATRLILAAGLGQNVLRLLALGIALGAFGDAPLATGLGWARWFGLLMLTGLALALMETLGDMAGHGDPERWALRLIPVMGPLISVLAPAAGLLRRLPTLGAPPRVGGRPTLVTEEEIKTLVDAGEEGGAIEEEEKEMIFSIFQLGDTLAREVMVPRIDIAGFEAEMPLSDAAQTLHRHRAFTRPGLPRHDRQHRRAVVRQGRAGGLARRRAGQARARDHAPGHLRSGGQEGR